MQRGTMYQLQLNQAPGIMPIGWAQVTGGGTTTAVNIQHANGVNVSVLALATGPNPVIGVDELIYRSDDVNQPGERRTIIAFA